MLKRRKGKAALSSDGYRGRALEREEERWGMVVESLFSGVYTLSFKKFLKNNFVSKKTFLLVIHLLSLLSQSFLWFFQDDGGTWKKSWNWPFFFSDFDCLKNFIQTLLTIWKVIFSFKKKWFFHWAIWNQRALILTVKSWWITGGRKLMWTTL